MYRISIHDIVGTSPPAFHLFDAQPRSWSKRINSAGRLVFEMPRWSTNATEDKLQKYRRVKLWRRRRDGTKGYDAVFSGYIEAHTSVDDRVEVVCPGMLDYFRKRFTNGSEQFNGAGSTEAFGLLTDTNAVNDTGVTSGTGGVVSTKDLTSDTDILRAWELIAQAHGAEFEIDDSFAFNFLPTLGTDKSSTIVLTFRRDETPGSNVFDYQDGEDARDMANRIIAKDSARTSTKNDTTSQTKYGIIMDKITISQSNDQATLDSMTDQYLTQRANPIKDRKVKPIMSRSRFDLASGGSVIRGLDLADVTPGDLVTINIITENQTLSSLTKRIAEFQVDVDDNGDESVRFTLTEADVFVTADLLDFEFQRENRRLIKEIESLL